MLVFALNAGSRSRKTLLFDVADDASFDAPEPVWQAAVEASDDTFGDLLARYDGTPPDVVAHRVVHPGVDYAIRLAVRLDANVERAIVDAIPFARAHNPLALEGIAATRERFGADVPNVAVSDIALAHDPPDFATLTAAPPAWRALPGVRRYGYHGISQRDVIARIGRAFGSDAGRRTISLHLGNGASASAFLGERLVETTMGLTPLDGLVMGQRSGALDPGLVLHAARELGLSPDDIEDALSHDGGRLGLSGVSADTRELERAIEAGDARAERALDYDAYRIRWHVGALAAILGGVDVLAFTGPVGEHAVGVRRRACAGLAHLGIALDDGKNDAGPLVCDVARSGMAVKIVIVPTLEEWAMARIAARIAC